MSDDDWKCWQYCQFFGELRKNERAGMPHEEAVQAAADKVDGCEPRYSRPPQSSTNSGSCSNVKGSASKSTGTPRGNSGRSTPPQSSTNSGSRSNVKGSASKSTGTPRGNSGRSTPPQSSTNSGSRSNVRGSASKSTGTPKSSRGSTSSGQRKK